MQKPDTLVLFFALISTFGPFISVAGGETADELTIRKLDADWSQALEDHNLEKAMSNYADDAVFLPPNMPPVEGKDHIQEWFAQRMSTPGYSASFVPTRIIVSKSRDMAYDLGAFRVTISGEQGKPIIRLGKHLMTWRKLSGRWRVTAESINYDQATPPR